MAEKHQKKPLSVDSPRIYRLHKKATEQDEKINRSAEA